MMVLEYINVFVGTSWSSCSFGVVYYITQYFWLSMLSTGVCCIFIFVLWECYIYKGDSVEFSADSLRIILFLSLF